MFGAQCTGCVAYAKQAGTRSKRMYLEMFEEIWVIKVWIHELLKFDDKIVYSWILMIGFEM